MSATEASKPKRRAHSRHIRDSTGLSPVRVTPRDIEILRTVGDYRILSTVQIQKLFFRSLHRTRKRLRGLWQHRLLDRRFQPIRLGEDTPHILYVLSQTGARLLAGRASSSGQATVPTPFMRRGSGLFLEHTSVCSDFRIAVTLDSRASPDYRLLYWRHQEIGTAVNLITGDATRRMVRVPIVADALFGIRHRQHDRHFFCEIDMGTTSHRRILLKLQAYTELWRRGLFRERFGIPDFRVLIVTVSHTRASRLSQTVAAQRQTTGCSRLFSFTTMSSAAGAAIRPVSGPIWHSTFSPEHRSLFEIA